MARRTIKRYLALCLAVVMLLTVLPVGGLALVDFQILPRPMARRLRTVRRVRILRLPDPWIFRSSRKKQSRMSSQGWSRWKTLLRSRRFRITRPSFPA